MSKKTVCLPGRLKEPRSDKGRACQSGGVRMARTGHIHALFCQIVLLRLQSPYEPATDQKRRPGSRIKRGERWCAAVEHLHLTPRLDQRPTHLNDLGFKVHRLVRPLEAGHDRFEGGATRKKKGKTRPSQVVALHVDELIRGGEPSPVVGCNFLKNVVRMTRLLPSVIQCGCGSLAQTENHLVELSVDFTLKTWHVSNSKEHDLVESERRA